jgi:hypothetical protein
MHITVVNISQKIQTKKFHATGQSNTSNSPKRGQPGIRFTDKVTCDGNYINVIRHCLMHMQYSIGPPPPRKNLSKKLEGSKQKLGGPDPPPPTPQWLRPCIS